MTLTEADLLRAAAAAGFQTEPLEKAIRLLELVETLRSHPFLKDRIALKGGREEYSAPRHPSPGRERRDVLTSRCSFNTF